MTPTALAGRYIEKAVSACAGKPSTETVLALALDFACHRICALEAGGFDRSATLARAADAKRAEGPPSL